MKMSKVGLKKTDPKNISDIVGSWRMGLAWCCTFEKQVDSNDDNSC